MNHHLDDSLIIGCVVGGFSLIAIAMLIVVRFRRRRRVTGTQMPMRTIDGPPRGTLEYSSEPFTQPQHPGGVFTDVLEAWYLLTRHNRQNVLFP